MKKTTKLWARAVCIALVFVLAFSLTACNLFKRGDGPTAPGKPINLVATAGEGKVSLSWEAADNGGAEITKYQVAYAKTGNNGAWKTAALDTGHTIDGLTNGTQYTFQVRAVNSVGDGEVAETTATPFIDENLPRKLTAERKKIINDAVDALDAAQTLNVKTTYGELQLESAGFSKYWVETQRLSTTNSFSGYIEKWDESDKYLDLYYLMASDGNWYLFDESDDSYQPQVFSTKADAEQNFKTAAEDIYGLAGLVKILGSASATLQTVGSMHTFDFFDEQTVNGERTTLTHKLVITDGKITSFKKTINKHNVEKSEHIITTTIEMDFTYTLSQIEEPADWQDRLFGDDGSAKTIGQLIMGINRAVDERDTWDSTDEKVFMLSVYAKYAKYFKNVGGGKFGFDENYLQDDDAMDAVWDAYVLQMFYDLSGGIDLYSNSLLDDLLANPEFLDRMIPGASGWLASYGELIGGNDGLRNMLLDNVEVAFEAYFGKEYTQASKTEVMLDELVGSYAIVINSRVTEYAINGGQNVVTIVYDTDIPVVPDDTLSTTERNLLSAAISNFENATTWTVVKKAIVETDEITEMNLTLARDGTGTNFKAVTIRNHGTSENYYSYALRGRDGGFYMLDYRGISVETAILVANGIYINGAKAEEVFNNGRNLEILESLKIAVEPSFSYDYISESLEIEIKDGKTEYTFLFKGEYLLEAVSEEVTRIIGKVEFSKKIIVVGESLTAMESIYTVTDVESGEIKWKNTDNYSFTYSATITPPASWEDDLSTGGEDTNMTRLFVALNYTANNPDEWNSTSQKVFTLKNYADYAPYFMYDEINEWFVFDMPNLDTSLNVLWDAYKIAYIYENYGVDLYSVGLYAQLVAAAKSNPILASMLSMGLLNIDKSDEENRTIILDFLDTALLSGVSDNGKKNRIIGEIGNVIIWCADGRITQYTDKNVDTIIIKYTDGEWFTTEQSAILDGAIANLKASTSWSCIMNSEASISGTDTIDWMSFAKGDYNGSFAAAIMTEGNLGYSAGDLYIKGSDGIYYLMRYDIDPIERSPTYVGHEVLWNDTMAEERINQVFEINILFPLENYKYILANIDTTKIREMYSEMGGVSTFVTIVTDVRDGKNFECIKTVKVENGEIVELLFEFTETDIATGDIIRRINDEYEFTYGDITFTPPDDWESYVTTTGPAKTVTELAASIISTIEADTNLSDTDSFTLGRTYLGNIDFFVYRDTEERFVFSTVILNNPDILEHVWGTYIIDQFYTMHGIDLDSEELYGQLMQIPVFAEEFGSDPDFQFMPDAQIRIFALAMVETDYNLSDLEKKGILVDALSEVYIIAENLVTEFVSLEGEILEVTYNS